MRIGIPREIKPGERRVGLTPEAVRALVERGHEVWVENGAGLGIGISDAEFQAAGARNGGFADAWGSTLVVKVKEIQAGEAERIARASTVFCFHHLAGDPALTRALAARGANAIAYELVRDERGQYPLLAPMSVIAGRMAIQVGAHLLGQDQGGNGTLLAGAPGAEAARVLVLGAGHAGSNAARLAAAMGAEVTLLGRSAATPAAVEAAALAADLVVGAVFVPGMPTPKLLPRALVRRMKRGAVIVDVSIDAGGVAETSHPTTHANPTFIEEGVVHYCVPNMPAAVARSSTRALSAATLPFVIEMASKGIERAVRENAALRSGVLIWEGVLTQPAIAADAGLPCRALDTLAA